MFTCRVNFPPDAPALELHNFLPLQDSAHFQNEQRKMAQVEERIARMREQATRLTAAELATHTRQDGRMFEFPECGTPCDLGLPAVGAQGWIWSEMFEACGVQALALF